MKIDDLVKKSNTGYPINKRYPPKLVAKYEKDLRLVVKLADEGRGLPTRRDLKEYFAEEYGMILGEAAIDRHIQRIRKGQLLWRS